LPDTTRSVLSTRWSSSTNWPINVRQTPILNVQQSWANGFCWITTAKVMGLREDEEFIEEWLIKAHYAQQGGQIHVSNTKGEYWGEYLFKDTLKKSLGADQWINIPQLAPTLIQVSQAGWFLCTPLLLHSVFT
jgi:hypothetical protein